jgi:hypothetical protein
MEIATYSEWGVFLSLALLAHNLMAAYYAYALFHYYLSLSLRNMQSVEDTLISALYQKAEALGITSISSVNAQISMGYQPNQGNSCNSGNIQDMRIYYYTRRSFMRNWCEMMGSSHFYRWVIPIPFFGR